MPIRILELEGGAISLEYDKLDHTSLSTAIQELFGAIQTVEQAPLYDVIEFGGERFTHYHEWEPCLISQSVVGSKMLRKIKVDS